MMPDYDIQTPFDLLNAGNSSEAIPHLESLVQHMPSHVTVHVLLAQALSEEMRWREALTAWQNALFLMPNSPAIRKGLRHVLRILARQAVSPSTSPAPSIVTSHPKNSIVDQPTVVPRETESKPGIKHDLSTKEDSLKDRPNSAPAISKPRAPKHSPFVPPALASFVDPETGLGEDEELDQLIQELETARIVPKPDYEAAEVPVEEVDLDEVASLTLARIYEGQKKYNEAAHVYDLLVTLQPEQAASFTEKAAELRARTAHGGN